VKLLSVLLLELEVGLVGSALVVAEESPQVDLVERIPLGVVGRAGQGRAQRPIGADKFEMRAVEIGADGMKVFPTPWGGTLELHPRLLLTESAVPCRNLIVHNLLEDGLVGKSTLKLDLVVLDLDYITRRSTQIEENQAGDVVEVSVELPHWKVEFAADLANGLLYGLGNAVLVVAAVLFDELADLTVELLLLLDEFNSIAGLVEASIAGIAVDNLILVITLGTETDLAISFEKTFQFFYLRIPLLLELVLDVEFFDHCHLKGILKHLLGLIRMASLEVEQDLSHPQLFLDLPDLLIDVGEILLRVDHSIDHLVPILKIEAIGLLQLGIPQFDFLVNFMLVLHVDDIVVQQLLDLGLVVLDIDDVDLQLIELELFVVNSLVDGVAKRGEVDVSIDDPAGLLAEVVVLLEGVGDEFVVLVAIEFDFSAEEDLQEAGTGEKGIGGDDLFLKVVLQFLGGVFEVEQLL
jgi:hypothetical protein